VSFTSQPGWPRGLPMSSLLPPSDQPAVGILLKYADRSETIAFLYWSAMQSSTSAPTTSQLQNADRAPVSVGNRLMPRDPWMPACAGMTGIPDATSLTTYWSQHHLTPATPPPMPAEVSAGPAHCGPAQHR